ncbi:thiolase family protein [Thioclava sp. FTW29]|uniref:Thiolase family protein n=1 Tax=Thioclava litoralis TaxID=3076557 RepID=A0ABZ1E362_9RHOB|nr:thiolase family protein [Thioclava sp. FTW29]
MRAVRVVAARRSAVVPRGGAFAGLDPHQLAAPVIAACLADAGLAAGAVDELICSNAIGPGGNLARVVALAAGLPQEVAGLTVDRQCAGGLDALLLGQALIAAGQADVVIAGGVESYSRRPLRAFDGPEGPEFYTQAPFTPWPERDPDMAGAADRLGQICDIPRGEADAWSVISHEKAMASQFPEIVEIAGIATDPYPRQMAAGVMRRAPVLAGAVTVANTAVAADAAAFFVLMAEPLARGRGLVVGRGRSLGGQPDLPGLAPVAAIRAIDGAGADRAEIMEAYAVQALACVRQAGLDPARVNLKGGALARGHPIGASGAILVVRLFHDLLPGETGLAAIAAAGGIGTALLLHRDP